MVLQPGQPIRTPNPIDYWLPIVVVFGGNTLAYIFCQIKKDNSYIDVLWGLTFIAPLVALLILFGATGQQIFARVWLNFVLISIWGIRLAIHIGIRHNGEDFRYVDMRNNWMKGGLCAYYISAFIYVFML